MKCRKRERVLFLCIYNNNQGKKEGGSGGEEFDRYS